MMFPHEGKIMMVDQLTYHDPQGLTTPSNVIPTITTIEPQGMTTHANVIPVVNTMIDNIPSSPLLNVAPVLFSLYHHDGFFPLSVTTNSTKRDCVLVHALVQHRYT